jgi:hypothetical protein
MCGIHGILTALQGVVPLLHALTHMLSQHMSGAASCNLRTVRHPASMDWRNAWRLRRVG